MCDSHEGVTLKIDAVMTGGLVHDWNKNHPRLIVTSGDHVVEVNGVRNNAYQLLKECQQAKILELTIRRVKGGQREFERSFVLNRRAVQLARLAFPRERYREVYEVEDATATTDKPKELEGEGAEALAIVHASRIPTSPS